MIYMYLLLLKRLQSTIIKEGGRIGCVSGVGSVLFLFYTRSERDVNGVIVSVRFLKVLKKRETRSDL